MHSVENQKILSHTFYMKKVRENNVITDVVGTMYFRVVGPIKD